MKTEEITIGGEYLATVSGKLVTLRVNDIIPAKDKRQYDSRKRTTSYVCTNLATGREVMVKSAMRFKRPAKQRMLAALSGPGHRAAAREVARNKGQDELIDGAKKHLDGRLRDLRRADAIAIANRYGLSNSAGSQHSAPTIEDNANQQYGLPVDSASQASDLPARNASLIVGVVFKPGGQVYHYQGLIPCAVGDTVEVQGGRTAVVSMIGGDYSGKMSQIIRVVKQSAIPDHVLKSAAEGDRRATLADKLREAAIGEASKPTFTPTEEQLAILDCLKDNPRVLVLEAGAGAGKTSTLRLIADVLEGNGQYTAFNSSLVKDSSIKFQGTNVACNTTHSLGFKAEGRRFAHRLNGQRVRSDRVAVILGIKEFKCTVDLLADKPATKRLDPSFLAGQVTTAIKRFCQSADKEISKSHFKYVDGIDPPSSSDNNEKLWAYLLPYARKAWQDLSDEKGQLPFAHDHYVKIWQLSNPIIPGDYILLDESQDTAPVMLDILQQQKCPVILVGDSAQQIYEWRGAVNAMAAFPDAPRKFLTQSFRFGQAIADVANAVLATLQEKTPLRIKGTPSIKSVVEKTDNPTCILCRTNAVAVSSLLAAIAAGKKPFLIGGTSELVSFVKAVLDLQQGRPTHHPELACFDSWREVKEYSELDEGSDLQLMVKLIDAFGATVIIGALENMVEEQDADITISTAHKSKGREWDRVRLASDFPTKSKCCDADRKLLYVAVTRAKLVLDVSRCPFFTGQDSLDILGADGKARPVIPAMVAPTTFTWAKGKNDTWLVRGPKGHEGKFVNIITRSGKVTCRRLAEVISEDEASATYRPY